ncbi:hypothetical protein SAMN05660472_02671 [Natronincola ferrireducens]|uniref:Uncharacterized protein n=1 Tax=Natronincola ferrireducens TaxID=393762 RepID=A0A1G9HKU1_9FIRM|nr:hypothetical protein SAMN05660472_02671 [Natronincola ferrireducens]
MIKGVLVKLIIVLLFFTGVVYLQRFLSKKKSKVLGLILPSMCFFIR